MKVSGRVEPEPRSDTRPRRNGHPRQASPTRERPSPGRESPRTALKAPRFPSGRLSRGAFFDLLALLGGPAGDGRSASSQPPGTERFAQWVSIRRVRCASPPRLDDLHVETAAGPSSGPLIWFGT